MRSKHKQPSEKEPEPSTGYGEDGTFRMTDGFPKEFQMPKEPPSRPEKDGGLSELILPDGTFRVFDPTVMDLPPKKDGG